MHYQTDSKEMDIMHLDKFSSGAAYTFKKLLNCKVCFMVYRGADDTVVTHSRLTPATRVKTPGHAIPWDDSETRIRLK
jgi:N-acetyl-anhydromuramyl-L-alanine amidase AmpD